MADFTFAHREEGFDEHINNSIRGYSDLLQDVISLSRYFIEDDTTVLDIGCNDGSQLDVFKSNNFKTYGVDPAKNIFKISSKKHNVICDFFNI